MTGLFDPFRLRGLRLKNRIGVSPMCQTSSSDGFSTDWHLVHLGARAVGGAGLVIAEATAVEARGRITDRDLGLWKDEHIPGLKRVAGFVRRAGAIAGIQLAHAGRKAGYCAPICASGMRPIRLLTEPEGAWQAIGPSAIPFEPEGPPPAQMTNDDIFDVVESFSAAAARAAACGFEWIQVHAAHGYLLHSFCSPLSNIRQDQFGGPFDNRVRLIRMVAQAIRTRIPSTSVLSFRLSYTDWIAGGWDTSDSVRLAAMLKVDGVDLIDVSSGGSTPVTVALMGHLRKDSLGLKTPEERSVPVAEIPVGPGYQVPGAEAIRIGANIPVAAVGLITDPHQAEDIVKSGKADLIMLARPLLRDPNWPIRAAQALGQADRMGIAPQYYLGWKDEANFTYAASEEAIAPD